MIDFGVYPPRDGEHAQQVRFCCRAGIIWTSMQIKQMGAERGIDVKRRGLARRSRLETPPGPDARENMKAAIRRQVFWNSYKYNGSRISGKQAV